MNCSYTLQFYIINVDHNSNVLLNKQNVFLLNFHVPLKKITKLCNIIEKQNPKYYTITIVTESEHSMFI